MSGQGQGCPPLGHAPVCRLSMAVLRLQSSCGCGCLSDPLLLLRVRGSRSLCPWSFPGCPKIGASLDRASQVLGVADPHITDAPVVI